MLAQFYKPEDNLVLFEVYRTICAISAAQTKGSSPVYLTYQQVVKEFNAKHASRKKIKVGATETALKTINT